MYKRITSKACQDGDVKATDISLNGVQPQANQAFYPNVNFEGKWYPICGRYFWDSNDGVTIICQKLGFQSGTRQHTHKTFTKDAIYVGRCRPGEDLTSCTAGGNRWPTVKDCEIGKGIGVTVKCQGGSGHKQTSLCSCSCSALESNLVGRMISYLGCCPGSQGFIASNLGAVL